MDLSIGKGGLLCGSGISNSGKFLMGIIDLTADTDEPPASIVEILAGSIELPTGII